MFRILVVISILCVSCRLEKPMTDQEVAIKWAEMTLFITKNTPGNSPTYASRCFGYIGVTMYESIVQGSQHNQPEPSTPQYFSIVHALNGLDSMPVDDPKADYDWRLSLNASQAFILKNLYNQTSDRNKNTIDSLENALLTHFSEKITDKSIVERSVAFGKAVAQSIFEWSKTDGGHRAYLKNFDKKMVHPNHAGCWKPPLYGQSFSHFPLHPHWGKNRAFLITNEKMAAPSVIPFDTMPQSAYYQQFRAVYNQEKNLTQDQKQAAVWWGDDPDETFTPPGHSYYLANLVVKKTQPPMIKCAETYAKVGLAVADAFRNCWKWKYQFFTERPNTYITEHIDERWESFWPDPPFPAFPSGHAIQAGAAMTVLTELYGENFAFTDDAHKGRKRDGLRNTEFLPRSFSSFNQAAQEIANSRFYGGIHTPQDNDAGLKKGQEIGQNIINLDWHK